MSIDIRYETAADVAAIDAVTIAAFLHAAHTSHTEHFIIRALRAVGGLTISLVAETDGLIVGHVGVSPVAISGGASGWFGLGPLSVAPSSQSRGVGTQLTGEALQQLRLRGAAGCVVLGDPKYYGRFGFAADPNLIFEGVPAEYFQAVAFGATRPHGTVSYLEAFNAIR